MNNSISEDSVGFGGHTPVDDPGNNGVTLLPFSGVNNINAPLYIQRIVTELGLDPYNPEHDAMFAWLNDESNEAQAVELFNFMYEQGYSAEATAFGYEALDYMAENPNISFNYLLYNKTELDDDETGDFNNNPIGGYNTTPYNSFNPQQNPWPTILSIIPISNFIGYGDSSVSSRECMDYAKAQIAIMGYQISNYFNSSGQTIAIYSEQNGADAIALGEGISYLKYALENDIPVIVGVDTYSGSPNPNTDNTTDHFVVIVGMGSDSSGDYFTFYDNATGLEPYENYGAHPNNKLYYDPVTGLISGTSETSYCENRGYGYYIVTQIRKSKPL